MEHLFVSYSAALGGAERILLDLAGGLGASTALACPQGPLAAAALRQGLHVEELTQRPLELRASARDRGGAPLRMAAQARELRGIARRLDPRVVVAWNMRGLLVAAAGMAGLRGARTLVFQHNDLLPGPAVAAIVRLAARRADRIACLSQAIAVDLDPRGRLGARVLHPGVDLERFAVEPPPVGEPPEALLLGAIVAWKRPDLALEAVAASRRLPELRLTVAGAPLDDAGRRLLAQLRRRADGEDLRGRVRFAGHVQDPRPALARSSCLLHCAPREPFGLALVEALACGRPVIAPRAAGPLEIVDPTCGRLYAPGDAPAAAAGLTEVLGESGRAVEMGAAGRERAERHFSLELAQERYRRLLAPAGERAVL